MKAGWLKEQIKRVSEDMKHWEPWMRREAGLERLDKNTSERKLEGKSNAKRKK